MRPSMRLASVTTATVLTLGVALTPSLAASGQNGQNGQHGQHGNGAAGNPSGRSIELTQVGTHQSGVFDESAAEIPAFDATSGRLFVVNALLGAVDVFTLDAQGAPEPLGTLTAHGLLAADGSSTDEDAAVNSVDAHGGTLAVAVEAGDKVSHGWVLFFDTATLDYLGGVRVGAQPDSLTWSPNGKQVVVANEGEPDEDFSTDPEGTISVIEVPASRKRIGTIDQGDVRTVAFTAYDQVRELPAGVRVFGPDVPVPAGQADAGRVARNLEPEYVAINHTGSTAYVSVQEANAIAVVDLKSATLTDLWAMPLKDWSAPGNVLDASDKDDINLANWPIFGIPMPDAIDTYTYRGQDLVVTANEGDAREWGEFEEPVRIKDKDYPLCEQAFPDAAALKHDDAIGRLEATIADGVNEEAGCYEQIHVFGGRSFTILDAQGRQLFDSAGMIEQQIAQLIEQGVLPQDAFNAANDENDSFQSRSDAKGPEPEGVVIGAVSGRQLAFVALERIGGIMVFDITNPSSVSYLTYVNNRNFDPELDAQDPGDLLAIGDLGAEGLEFVPASASPTGAPLVIVANEVSGSTTVYEVSTTR